MGQKNSNHSMVINSCDFLTGLLSLRTVIIILMLAIPVLFTACRKGPKVPHEIVSAEDESCRSCHKTGENDAPVVSHIDRKNCLRCHESSKQTEDKAQLSFSKMNVAALK